MRGPKRISKEQWLSTALELFSESGEGGLRVEALARTLSISKSGFYFQFKDRDDFLQQLLAYWVNEYTTVIIDNPLLAMTPPRQRLLMISTLVFEQNLTRFDAAMYVWASKNPQIAKQVRKVTDMRLKFTSKVFAELGFEGDDLEMRARGFIAYLSGERAIFGSNKKIAERHRELRLNMLLGD